MNTSLTFGNRLNESTNSSILFNFELLEFFRDADLSGIRTIIVELHRYIYHRPGMREIREEILVDKGFNEDRECSGGGVFVFRAV